MMGKQMLAVLGTMDQLKTLLLLLAAAVVVRVQLVLQQTPQLVAELVEMEQHHLFLEHL